MKAVERRMLQAVKERRNYRERNTVVNVENGDVRVYLHGNCIFASVDGVERFTLAGWNTVTTRSRLNALGVYVSQKNWQPIYDGKVIKSWEWYTV